VPENRAEPPLPSETEPETAEPTVSEPPPDSAALGVQVMTPVVPALNGVPPDTFATVPVALPPPALMVHAVGVVLAVPVLVQYIVQTGVVPSVQVVDVVVTVAVFVNDPNRPKTNPAIAIAAISVMAIRMTVARTGEIAFLLPAWCVSCIFRRLYGSVPDRSTLPPLDSDAVPVNAEPEVPATVHPVVKVTSTVPAPAPIVTGKDVSAGVQVVVPVAVPYVRVMPVTAALAVPVFEKAIKSPTAGLSLML